MAFSWPTARPQPDRSIQSMLSEYHEYINIWRKSEDDYNYFTVLQTVKFLPEKPNCHFLHFLSPLFYLDWTNSQLSQNKLIMVTTKITIRKYILENVRLFHDHEKRLYISDNGNFQSVFIVMRVNGIFLTSPSNKKNVVYCILSVRQQAAKIIILLNILADSLEGKFVWSAA